MKRKDFETIAQVIAQQEHAAGLTTSPNRAHFAHVLAGCSQHFSPRLFFAEIERERVRLREAQTAAETAEKGGEGA